MTPTVCVCVSFSHILCMLLNCGLFIALSATCGWKIAIIQRESTEGGSREVTLSSIHGNFKHYRLLITFVDAAPACVVYCMPWPCVCVCVWVSCFLLNLQSHSHLCLIYLLISEPQKVRSSLEHAWVTVSTDRLFWGTEGRVSGIAESCLMWGCENKEWEACTSDSETGIFLAVRVSGHLKNQSQASGMRRHQSVLE